MSLKWIKSLNLTRETLKLAEENRGSVLTLVLVMIFFVAFDPRRKGSSRKNRWGSVSECLRQPGAGEKGSRPPA